MISAAGRVGWEEARRVSTNDAPLSDKDFRAKQEERFAKLGLRKQREGRSHKLPRSPSVRYMLACVESAALTPIMCCHVPTGVDSSARLWGYVILICSAVSFVFTM